MRESQHYWCRYTPRALREIKQRFPSKLCCFSTCTRLTPATRMLKRSFAASVYGFNTTQAAEETALVTGARLLGTRLPAFQMSQVYHLHVGCVPEGLQPQHKLQVKNSGYLNLGATHHPVKNYPREAIKMQQYL